ncbi:MAG: hypothetical protein PHQ74_10825 [Crocinitomicaceae bacterium]|nr:hypothetical protein [Crocinitomicaceae bacterium]
MSTKNAILKQTAIFLGYLFFCSLLLFNHSGGGDMAFAVLVGISIFLHVIILLVKTIRCVVKKSGKPPYVELFTVILLVNVFILLLPSYLQFMWWLTNRT